jgi:hypothetical protein
MESRASTVSPSPTGSWSTEPPAPATEGLPLLLRLRWLAIPGQLLALLVLPSLVGIAAPRVALLLPVAVGLSNLAAVFLARRLPSASLAGSLIVLDMALLACWLWWAGGAVNPFTILFLVQIALAALVLGPGWTWTVAGVATCFFGLLPPCRQRSWTRTRRWGMRWRARSTRTCGGCGWRSCWRRR